MNAQISPTVEQLARDFVIQIQNATREEFIQQLANSFGSTVAMRKKSASGLPALLDFNETGTAALGKVRRKLPPQFCPVPRCKGKAAPIFGMVCAKHKDVPKAEIAKYREARRAKNGMKKGKAA